MDGGGRLFLVETYTHSRYVCLLSIGARIFSKDDRVLRRKGGSISQSEAPA